MSFGSSLIISSERPPSSSLSSHNDLPAATTTIPQPFSATISLREGFTKAALEAEIIQAISSYTQVEGPAKSFHVSGLIALTSGPPEIDDQACFLLRLSSPVCLMDENEGDSDDDDKNNAVIDDVSRGSSSQNDEDFRTAITSPPDESLSSSVNSLKSSSDTLVIINNNKSSPDSAYSEDYQQHHLQVPKMEVASDNADIVDINFSSSSNQISDSITNDKHSHKSQPQVSSLSPVIATMATTTSLLQDVTNVTTNGIISSNISTHNSTTNLPVVMASRNDTTTASNNNNNNLFFQPTSSDIIRAASLLAGFSKYEPPELAIGGTSAATVNNTNITPPSIPAMATSVTTACSRGDFSPLSKSSSSSSPPRVFTASGGHPAISHSHHVFSNTVASGSNGKKSLESICNNLASSLASKKSLLSTPSQQQQPSHNNSEIMRDAINDGVDGTTLSSTSSSSSSLLNGSHQRESVNNASEMTSLPQNVESSTTETSTQNIINNIFKLKESQSNDIITNLLSSAHKNSCITFDKDRKGTVFNNDHNLDLSMFNGGGSLLRGSDIIMPSSENQITDDGGSQIINSVDERLYCSMCNKNFTSRSAFYTHRSVLHSRRPPVKCNDCGKIFTQKSQLLQHEVIHTGAKPYECKYCHKRCAYKTNLDKHIRIHTGEKPFRCKFCPRLFSDGSNLVKHERKHSNLNQRTNGVNGVDSSIIRRGRRLRRNRQVNSVVEPTTTMGFMMNSGGESENGDNTISLLGGGSDDDSSLRRRSQRHNNNNLNFLTLNGGFQRRGINGGDHHVDLINHDNNDNNNYNSGSNNILLPLSS